VHAVLARAPFDADRSSLETIASVEARLLALDDADGAAAAAVVERVLAHDLLVRARHADARGGCRRETPITLTLEDGTLVEGSVDLAFEEDGRWVVVDYKTDREIAEKGDVQYRRQLSLYAAAIERATGQPVEGVLVRI
jgi:ATP-dependent exoDNAse (exonuclease V) beta subunit